MTSLPAAIVAALRAQVHPEQRRRYATPGELAKALDGRTVQTPALDIIDEALVDLFNTPDGRLILCMPPQEGKSTRVMDFVIWALEQNPETRVATASYAQGLANRNGRKLRNTIITHPELGLRIAPDNGSVSEWTLDGHQGGVLSVGRGAGITGRPVDLLVIDDPLKDRIEADSQTIREGCWDWWTDSLSTRLAPGAPVILILTRWHEQDLAGKLLDAEDGHLWRVINIPAEADHDPAAGETDLLGREPGEYLTSARRRTPDQWQAIKVRVGSRTWNALYQGRPAPAEGGILKRQWLTDNAYTTPPWTIRDDGTRWVPNAGQILTSWDMAFKDTDGSDYVVGQVWMLRGPDAYLLDQTRARLSFTDTVQAFLELAARWPQATAHLVEDKANGTAVLSQLRKVIPGLIPITPKESKEARASAVTPYMEAGNVHVPSPQIGPWVGDLLDECAAFPNGSHDDQVDAMSQALARLFLGSSLTGFLNLLAPPCPECGTPIPTSAKGVCPHCHHGQPDDPPSGLSALYTS